jgi:hypothetical protein
MYCNLVYQRQNQSLEQAMVAIVGDGQSYTTDVRYWFNMQAICA